MVTNDLDLVPPADKDVGMTPRSAKTLLLILGFFLPSLATWAYFRLPLGPVAGQGLYGLSKVLAFALPLIWIIWLTKEKVRLPRPTRRGLAEGLVSGLLIGGLMVAGYFLFVKGSPGMQAGGAAITEKLAGFGVTTAAMFIAFGVFIVLMNASIEEYYWRGFMFKRLGERMTWLPAALLSGFGFMLHHVIIMADYFEPGLVALCSLGVMVGGVIWAWQYRRTGCIYSAWLSHAIVDVAVYIIAFDLIFRS